MQTSDIDARLRFVLVIWGALLLGVTFFAAVVWALTTGLIGGAPWTPVLEPGVVRNLLGAPVLLMVAGIFYRRGEIAGTDDGEYLQNYQTRVIIASAMQEGGGLLGIGLCLLAGMSTGALGMWLLTAVAMLLSRPRRWEMDRLP